MPLFQANLAKVRKVEADELLAAFAVEPALSDRHARQQAVVDWIGQGVADGQINRREDVIQALESIGTLNRVGDDYVSVRFKDMDKPIRFKGALFSTAFNADVLRQTMSAPAPTLSSDRDPPDPDQAEQEREAFERAVKARAKWNLARYGPDANPEAPDPDLSDSQALESLRGDEAASPGSSPSFPPTDAIHAVDPDTHEVHHDRNRNPAVATFLDVVDRAAAAVRRLAKACQRLVESIGRLERASAALERASQRPLVVPRGLKQAETGGEVETDRMPVDPVDEERPSVTPAVRRFRP